MGHMEGDTKSEIEAIQNVQLTPPKYRCACQNSAKVGQKRCLMDARIICTDVQ